MHLKSIFRRASHSESCTIIPWAGNRCSIRIPRVPPLGIRRAIRFRRYARFEEADSACIKEDWRDEAGGLSHFPAYPRRVAPATWGRCEDHAGIASPRESWDHDGVLSAGRQRREKGCREAGVFSHGFGWAAIEPTSTQRRWVRDMDIATNLDS